MKSLLEVAYDAKLTQQCGRVLVDALAEHLARVQRGQGPVQRWRDPEENISEARRWLEEAGFSESPKLVSKFQELVKLSLQRGQNLNHPRCVGHQVPAPLPIRLTHALTSTYLPVLLKHPIFNAFGLNAQV